MTQSTSRRTKSGSHDWIEEPGKRGKLSFVSAWSLFTRSLTSTPMRMPFSASKKAVFPLLLDDEVAGLHRLAIHADLNVILAAM
jgi:hypothetical protein